MDSRPGFSPGGPLSLGTSTAAARRCCPSTSEAAVENATEGEPDWQELLERGGHWEFALSLDHEQESPDDIRGLLRRSDGGYTVKVVVGADDAAARFYEVDIDWNEDAEDVVAASESMTIGIRHSGP